MREDWYDEIATLVDEVKNDNFNLGQVPCDKEYIQNCINSEKELMEKIEKLLDIAFGK